MYHTKYTLYYIFPFTTTYISQGVLVPLEADVLAHHDATQCTHQLEGDSELLELTGQQVEPFHLHKVRLYIGTTTLEVFVQDLVGVYTQMAR